jgi:signal transduction histidine kinase
MTKTWRHSKHRHLAEALRQWTRTWERPADVTRLRSEAISVGMIFLGLIILPATLLGYLSWRSVQSERALFQERLEDSYEQVARLAAQAVRAEMERLESEWTSRVNAVLPANGGLPIAEALKRLTEQEALIADLFLLTGPGTGGYPAAITFHEDAPPLQLPTGEGYAREYELFERLVNQGEELEYHAYDLGGAIATYRAIASRVHNGQLRAIAESYIGRTQMKQGDWAGGLRTFQRILVQYSEVRDLNSMYLRFLAQYQIANSLETLGRDEEAVETLLRLHRDLLERSDRINTIQYSYFVDLIRDLAPRLLASPGLSDPSRYEAEFRALTSQNKKRISQKYFLQLLNREFTEALITRKPYREKYYYVSDQSTAEPYLLAYRFLPNKSGLYVGGLLGIQLNLERLSQRLSHGVTARPTSTGGERVALLNRRGEPVVRPADAGHTFGALHPLDPPLDFWQVGVAVPNGGREARLFVLRTTFWLWLIALLLFSIVFGASLFIRRVRRERHLSHLKSSFVSNVSHELRTPLASIRMFAELLEFRLDDHAGGPEQAWRGQAGQYLRIIRRDCDRLNRLIDNVLNFSKIERGVIPYHLEYEDPASVLQGAIDSFRLHAEAQGFTVDLLLPEQVTEVRMDADAIFQVLLNLLSNAMKYGGEDKAIRVRAYQEDSRLVVEVTDHGIGIPPEEVPKIFEPFYRIDQRINSRTQGGMGLGLTLARTIVRDHGGEMTVHSKVGSGSTFRFTLPIAAEAGRVRADRALADKLQDSG